MYIIYGDIYTGGIDFESGPYYVNITEGNLSGNHCIDIIDDKIRGIDKKFLLKINTTALPSEIITVESYNSTTVTIQDDERM